MMTFNPLPGQGGLWPPCPSTLLCRSRAARRNRRKKNKQRLFHSPGDDGLQPLPEDFSKILAVMRSRQVFVSIILQNIAALKALFEKEWESILGNCDEFLYLGGNETSTHKLISESYLGKATIDTNTYGKSSGRNGNYSTNYQITGRELMTPDEVRMLDNRYALLFIRGEPPIMDEKFDILKHPNVALTTDGKAKPYQHGGTENAVATLSLVGIPLEGIPDMEEIETDYELLSDEDVEALLIGT